MVALPTAGIPHLGTSSRYLLTLSPKPRPAPEHVRAHLEGSPTDGLAIKRPQDHSRIRRVLSRSGTRRRYIIPSCRYGTIEAHNETAEEDAAAFILLDSCPGVEFKEQPARFIFQWCGETCQHTADSLVASRARWVFWECKRTEEAGNFWIRKHSEWMRELRRNGCLTLGHTSAHGSSGHATRMEWPIPPVWRGRAW